MRPARGPPTAVTRGACRRLRAAGDRVHSDGRYGLGPRVPRPPRDPGVPLSPPGPGAGRGSGRAPPRPPRRSRAGPCRGRRVHRRHGSGSRHRQRDQHGGNARWPVRRQRPRWVVGRGLRRRALPRARPARPADRGRRLGRRLPARGPLAGHVKVADLAFDLQASPASPTRRILSRRLRDRRTLYVLRAHRTTTYRRARRRFFALARELGYQPALVRRFSDPKAGPQFEVYSAARRPG